MNIPDIKLRERVLYGEQQVDQLNSLTTKLKKIIKLSKQYTQTAFLMNSLAQQISACISELSAHTYYKIDSKYEEFANMIAKLENTHYFVAQQMEFMFESPMNSFLEEELKYSAEIQKVLQQSKNDYDQLHRRYYTSLIEGVKPKEELSLEMLTSTEECTRIYKDFNTKLNNSLTLSNFDITERICSYMYLLFNSQYQGYETLVKVQPIIATMMEQLNSSREEFSQFNSKPDYLDQLISDAVDSRFRLGTEKQGYLLMRKKNIWKLVWVKVRDDSLICYKRWKSGEEIFVIELTISTFKLSSNENLVFKLISPKMEAEFKATNEVELQSWKSMIENAIKKGLKLADNYGNNNNSSTPHINNRDLYINLNNVNNNQNINNNTSPPSTSPNSPPNQNINNNNNINNNTPNNFTNLNTPNANQKNRLTRIESVYWKGVLFTDQKNAKCADCEIEDPEWASLNLGILLCQHCCGIHRSMGVHVSKVKSLLLDRWSEPQLKILELIGNDRANSFWENQIKVIQTESTKPNKYSTHSQRQSFIHAKYLQKLFLPIPSPSDNLDKQLYRALKCGDIFQISKLIATGCDINLVYKKKPLIHWAILQRNITVIEFILHQNCDINSIDSNLTPLDLAIQIDDFDSINILTSYGAKRYDEIVFQSSTSPKFVKSALSSNQIAEKNQTPGKKKKAKRDFRHFSSLEKLLTNNPPPERQSIRRSADPYVNFANDLSPPYVDHSKDSSDLKRTHLSTPNIDEGYSASDDGNCDLAYCGEIDDDNNIIIVHKKNRRKNAQKQKAASAEIDAIHIKDKLPKDGLETGKKKKKRTKSLIIPELNNEATLKMLNNTDESQNCKSLSPRPISPLCSPSDLS